MSLASSLAVLLLVCVLLLGTLGVAGAAARNALPGETLYPLKITYEAAQLAFAPTAAERAHLHLTFARNRVDETLALVAAPNGGIPGRDEYANVPPTLSAYEQEVQRANDALETIPAQDYSSRVLVASDQEQSLSQNAAALNSLLAKSPADLKDRVSQTIGVTDENIGAARQAMAEAALLRATPTTTKVAVAVRTLNPTAGFGGTPAATPTALVASKAAQTSIPTPTRKATLTPIPPPVATNTSVPATSSPNSTNVPAPASSTPPPPTETPQATVAPPPTGTPPPEGPSGQYVLWSADMETGDLSQWALPGELLAADQGGGVYDERSGSVSVTDRVAHGGRYSIEMTINDGGGTDQAVRIFRWYENPVQAYYSVWYLFPQSYTPARWWNVMQFKSKAPYPKDTLWVLNVGNRPSGEMYFYLYDWQQCEGYNQTVRDIPVGRWVHVEVLYRRSATKSGRVAVWQDGVLLFDQDGVQTTTAGDVQWSVDNYTDQISPSPATIYADDAAISTKRIDP